MVFSVEKNHNSIGKVYLSQSSEIQVRILVVNKPKFLKISIGLIKELFNSMDITWNFLYRKILKETLIYLEKFSCYSILKFNFEF